MIKNDMGKKTSQLLERIRIAYKEKWDANQVGFSKATGLSRSQVSMLLSGSKGIGPDQAMAACAVLGIDPIDRNRFPRRPSGEKAVAGGAAVMRDQVFIDSDPDNAAPGLEDSERVLVELSRGEDFVALIEHAVKMFKDRSTAVTVYKERAMKMKATDEANNPKLK